MEIMREIMREVKANLIIEIVFGYPKERKGRVLGVAFDICRFYIEINN